MSIEQTDSCPVIQTDIHRLKIIFSHFSNGNEATTTTTKNTTLIYRKYDRQTEQGSRNINEKAKPSRARVKWDSFARFDSHFIVDDISSN